MRTSLRTRLLVATVIASFLALLIVDGATYALVTRSQLDQVDHDLERSHTPIERATLSPPDERADAIERVAPSTYVEVRDEANRRVTVVPLRRTGAQPLRLARIDLAPNPSSRNDDDAVFATVRDTTGTTKLRIRVSRQEAGGSLVIGQSIARVDQTRQRLVQVLSAGTLAALVIVGAVGAWLVRVGLGPLTDVETTAAGISETDLDRRIQGANEHTEVGRLATTINRMLERLAHAFDLRQASEERMRRFVADASHELRTPLAATAAYAELFDRGAKDRPEDLARAMAGIKTETARMTELVDDLLLLAQLDEHRPLQRSPVDLDEVAANAVQAAHVVAPDRHVGLQIDDVVVVSGDPSRLRQVFDNLLANVRSHTPPGTPCHIRIARDGDVAVVSVTDEGPGIPVADLARVTNRFFRADASRSRSSGGSGLGLAIVAAIVEAHDGTVSITNRPEGGLRVEIRLPAQ